MGGTYEICEAIIPYAYSQIRTESLRKDLSWFFTHGKTEKGKILQGKESYIVKHYHLLTGHRGRIK